MIIETIVTASLHFITSILKPVGVVFVHGTEFLDIIMPFVEIVFYVLPIGTIVAIFKTIIAIQVFRITVALLKSLWDIIPVL